MQPIRLNQMKRVRYATVMCYDQSILMLSIFGLVTNKF